MYKYLTVRKFTVQDFRNILRYGHSHSMTDGQVTYCELLRTFYISRLRLSMV